jgi:hypothetical protein
MSPTVTLTVKGNRFTTKKVHAKFQYLARNCSQRLSTKQLMGSPVASHKFARSSTNAVPTMIKPTLSLMFVTVSLVQSSLSSPDFAATAEADSSSPTANHPHLQAPSSRLRRAAAAGVPPQERKLQNAQACFMVGGAGPSTPVACSQVSCSVATCVADEDTAKREGSNVCEENEAFAIANPNRTECIWQYSCCTCCTVTYDDTS